jgi:hypothetical protein
VKTTSDPCHKGWGFSASSGGPGHRDPYHAASRGRVARPWSNREHEADSHAACLLVRLYASTPLVVVVGLFLAGLSRTLAVGTIDEVVHRVLERTCPRLVQRRNRLVVVAHGRKMPYGHGQSVLDGGEMTVCHRRASRSRVSGASQTCQR